MVDLNERDSIMELMLPSTKFCKSVKGCQCFSAVLDTGEHLADPNALQATQL